jgi:epoxyqueuosine reductase
MTAHADVHRASIVKEEAYKAGFQYCGISKAGFLADEAPRLEQWLAHGSHGNMSYMERNFEKRLDPTKLVEGARSVVSLLYNYYPGQKNSLNEPGNLKVST